MENANPIVNGIDTFAILVPYCVVPSMTAATYPKKITIAIPKIVISGMPIKDIFAFEYNTFLRKGNTAPAIPTGIKAKIICCSIVVVNNEKKNGKNV